MAGQCPLPGCFKPRDTTNKGRKFCSREHYYLFQKKLCNLIGCKYLKEAGSNYCSREHSQKALCRLEGCEEFRTVTADGKHLHPCCCLEHKLLADQLRYGVEYGQNFAGKRNEGKQHLKDVKSQNDVQSESVIEEDFEHYKEEREERGDQHGQNFAGKRNEDKQHSKDVKPQDKVQCEGTPESKVQTERMQVDFKPENEDRVDECAEFKENAKHLDSEERSEIVEQHTKECSNEQELSNAMKPSLEEAQTNIKSKVETECQLFRCSLKTKSGDYCSPDHDQCKLDGCLKPRPIAKNGKYLHLYCTMEHKRTAEKNAHEQSKKANSKSRKKRKRKQNLSFEQTSMTYEQRDKVPKKQDKGPIYFYNKYYPYYEFTNFYIGEPITIDGLKWKTTEHYFQAQKFVETPYTEVIRNLSTPREAFEFSRKPSLFQWQRKDWQSIKQQVMYKALLAKFSQSQKLRTKLAATGSRELVEHSPYDRYWGDGGDGSGENHLGELLMKIRGHVIGNADTSQSDLDIKR